MNTLHTVTTNAPERARRSTKGALLAWSALVAVAFIWGRIPVRTHHNLLLSAPPFWSPWGFHPSVRLIPALLIAGVGVQYGPDIAQHASWKTLLAATALTSSTWATATAYINGPHALTDPLTVRQFDYLQTATKIHSLHTYLSQFVAKIATYNQHTMGHPPAMVVIEWILTRLGIATPGWNTILVMSGGAVSGIAALIALRELVGEHTARRAAPFVALVPAVLWWQTADAFFAGVSATAVTLVILASGREDRRADVYALAGGLLFGLTLFLSYGLAPLALLPIMVCATRRRMRPLAIGAVGIVPWFAGFAAFGFSWFAGFAATRHEYWIAGGAASQRPYRYFLVADLAVFALATGPAVGVAVTRISDRRLRLLVGGIFAVVALADLSGMSKGEVERIWLPFVPWAMVATAALGSETNATRGMRRWLTLQTASTIILAIAIRSQW